MNEWVKLMLEEVRRKAREREAALQEHKRRQSAPPGEAPAEADARRPADRADHD